MRRGFFRIGFTLLYLKFTGKIVTTKKYIIVTFHVALTYKDLVFKAQW